MKEQKEFLKAAAEAVKRQAAEDPGLGVPVDPEVADFMGAFEETAFSQDDLENVDLDEGA